MTIDGEQLDLLRAELAQIHAACCDRVRSELERLAAARRRREREERRLALVRALLDGDVQVLQFDPDGDGRMVVVDGDLSTAANLVITVPGISNSLETFDRPNLVAGQPLTLPNPTPTQWLNKAAFTLPPTGTFGNAGRNILTAPGFEDIDFAVSKMTAIKERFSLQLRGEAFNLFNHPNFDIPASAIGAAPAGTISAVVNNERQMQVAAKFYF